MADGTQQTSEKSKKPEVVQVQMSDGRTVGFTGNRKLLKETLIDESKLVLDGNTLMVQAGAVSTRLDFKNGETRTFAVPLVLFAKSAGHGSEQKLGDETAGEKDVDDMVIAVDDLIDRLTKGEWTQVREAGGFAGASVVVRALMEVSGKTQEDVKAFLQKKLDAAVAKGEKLSRKELYDSFRVEGTKTGEIIRRMEAEKIAKNAKVDADKALAELGTA